MEDEFERRNGFPRPAATLANWRIQPFSAWAFRNAAELVPSARIATASPRLLPPIKVNPTILGKPFIPDANETLAWFLARSQTDSFLIARNGTLLCEWHAAGVDRNDPHILFSITKSITAIVAGILEEKGLLDPVMPVGTMISQARRGAYGDATIRDLLDMRVSLDFEESYLSDGDYARYRRAMLWNPPVTSQQSEPDNGLLALLCSLRKGPEPHGGAHCYRSPNTDMLGAVIEQAAGRRFSELASSLLWQPLQASADAFLTVDRFGAPRTAGGISCRPHDLLALGQMLLDGGTVAGERIVTKHWLDDMLHNGDGGAWAKGNQADFLKNGRYRSCWYQAGDSDAFLAAGIHGQYLYVDPASHTVIVKLASQDEPQDDVLDRQNMALFRTLCAA